MRVMAEAIAARVELGKQLLTHQVSEEVSTQRGDLLALVMQLLVVVKENISNAINSLSKRSIDVESIQS